MSTRFAAADFAVADDIRRAETLPAVAFRDRDFLNLELDTLFARSWLFVPLRGPLELRDDPRSLADMVRVRGARAPFSLLDRPLFLQRGWDDDGLRCFANACTHAWYPLVPGPARGNTLVCGQHGRKFDCAGRYLSQPGFMQGVPDFPRECDHLRAFPVASWNDLLFTCLGDPTAPFADLFAPVSESVARLPLADLTRAPQPDEAREVAGNWKQHSWNYMDKFHVGFIHRAPGGLADAIDMTTYKTELHGRAALQWAYARDPAAGFDPARLPDRFRDPSPGGTRRVFALWWFVFPNLTLNFYPWGLSVNVYQPIPERPEASLFLWYHFVMDRARYEQRNDLWLSDQVDAEDLDALAQVRRGIRSGLTPRGRFAPAEETGPHWFHRQVFDAVFGQR